MPVNNNNYYDQGPGNLYGATRPAYGYVPAPVDPYHGPYSVQQPQLVYVHGIDGANAYQLPQGVTKAILWDENVDSFYIKAVDEMGRPRVIAWKDFIDHVVPPAPEVQQAPSVDTSKFITKDDLNQILNRLYVGERGRIMINEFDS